MASEQQSILSGRYSLKKPKRFGSIADLLFEVKKTWITVMADISIIKSKRALTFLFIIVLLSMADSTSAQCNAAFTLKFSPNDSTAVVFYDTISSNQTINIWNFGDGQNVTADTTRVVHRYLKNGSYAVCHVVGDSTGSCSDSACRTVVIKQVGVPCKASFTYTATDSKVAFVNTSVHASKIRWSFGDGVISNENSPSHDYKSTAPTTYNVCLFTQDTTTGCSDTICMAVFVRPNITSCTATFTSTLQGLEASFLSSTPNVVRYLWQFGDGDTSASSNPKHTYKKAENYTVCLTIWNQQNCSDSTCSTITVSNPKCKPEFRVGIDTSEKFKLYLLNTSTNHSSHQYLWDFGDGSESIQRNPSHQYATFGAYRICLTIQDTFYTCENSFCDTVGIDKDGKLLKAGFNLEVIEDNFVSAPALDLAKLSIYPNPVKDYLHISLDHNMYGADIQVISLDGAVLHEANIQYENHIKLDVSFLMDGFYILVVNDGQNVYRNRFVKRN